MTTFQNARRRYACQAYGSAQVFDVVGLISVSAIGQKRAYGFL
jgi:hypothetical protein